MTPVISPWAFYAISMADRLNIFFLILSLVLVGIVGAFAIWKVSDLDWKPHDEVQALCDKVLKKTILPTIFVIILTLIIPSSSTITKMIIAQNVTYERVEAATDTVETVYNDIMELFENDEES